MSFFLYDMHLVIELYEWVAQVYTSIKFSKRQEWIYFSYTRKYLRWWEIFKKRILFPEAVKGYQKWFWHLFRKMYIFLLTCRTRKIFNINMDLSDILDRTLHAQELHVLRTDYKHLFALLLVHKFWDEHFDLQICLLSFASWSNTCSFPVTFPVSPEESLSRRVEACS